MADFIGSTSAIIDWCASQEADEFIVMTESGVRYSLEKMSPRKTFYFLPNENCNCSECPYMKRNTLEKLRDALRTLEPRVELSADIMARARLPIDRMLAMSMTPLSRHLRPSPRQSPDQRHRPLQYPLLLLHARRPA